MVSNGFDLVRALLISSPSRLSKILYNQPAGYSDTQRQTEPYVSLHNGGLVRPGSQHYDDAIWENDNAILKFLYHHLNWIF